MRALWFAETDQAAARDQGPWHDVPGPAGAPCPPWPSRPLWRTFLDERATSLATRQEALAMLSREDNELLTRVDYLLDRQVQKTETFTGIDGVNVQGRAVQESMGPVVDRSKEHLGPVDKAIIQARRLLLQAVRTVREGGTPRGVDPTYYALRAAEGVLLRDADWRTILAPEVPATEILQTV